MSVSRAFHKIQLNVRHASLNWALLQSRRNLQLTGINSYLVNVHFVGSGSLVKWEQHTKDGDTPECGAQI